MICAPQVQSMFGMTVTGPFIKAMRGLRKFATSCLASFSTRALFRLLVPVG